MKRAEYLPATSASAMMSVVPMAAADPAPNLADIGHSYFWNKPLRGPSDPTGAAYLIEGLQSIDICLETLPTNEGYRQVAITFVDHLLSASLRAVRAGHLIPPVGLVPRLEEFSISWRLIGVARDTVLRQASVIADLSVDLKPAAPAGSAASFVVKARTFIANNAAICYAVQCAFVIAIVAVGAAGSLSVAALVVLCVVWALLDAIYKRCVSEHAAQCRENTAAFDAFASRLARLASSNLPLAQFAPTSGGGLVGPEGIIADDGDHSAIGAEEDEAEEIGQMFSQSPFLLHPDDALQRKGSIDAMLGEADDDEGCVLLRVRGLPKVTIELSALSPHLLIAVTDAAGKVTLWNDGAAVMTGFAASDAEGMKLTSFLFGDASVSAYALMVEAAAREGGDASAKPLSLANTTYGHVTVKGTVTRLTDDAKETVGYALVASRQGERSARQHLFHQYFLGELGAELRRVLMELAQSEDAGRCGQILEAMRWTYLRDLAASAQEWRSSFVHGLLSEALRDRHRQVDVRVDPLVPEQIVCDQLAVSRTVTRALGLLQGRLRLTIARQAAGATNLLSQLLISAGPASYLTAADLRDLHGMAAAVGGEASITPRQEIALVFPYLTEGASANLLADDDDGPTGGAAAGGVGGADGAVVAGGSASASSSPAQRGLTAHPPAPPITILLFERHAVHRHTISTIAFAGGHSVRVVEHLSDALRALSEGGGAAQFGCAMIDVDIRDVGGLLEALRAAGVYLVEMSEAEEEAEGATGGGRKRGGGGHAHAAEAGADGAPRRIVLTKPVSRAQVEFHLAAAAESVSTRRREEDRITKQRAILSTQRNSPWVKGRKLGHGAFANVFEATSTLTGGKMAVKMIRLRRGKDEAERAKTLLNEIEILCQLEHPNIIHYFYCEPTEETLNLFMELATGGSLQDLLQRSKGGNGEPPLPEARVAYFTRELLHAVQYLHDQDIIHRDIKPGNILLSGRAGDAVKLTDFGTATQEAASDTQGTIEYMAPEVLGVGSSGGGGGGAFADADGAHHHNNNNNGAGPQSYSKECDVWSVGCVVCKCLGIERPPRDGTLFGGLGVPAAYPSHVSAAAREFINLCLQEDPAERATAGTLLLHDFIVNSRGAALAMGGGGAAVAAPDSPGAASADIGGGGGAGGGGGEMGRRSSVMSVWTDDDEAPQQQPTAPPTATSVDMRRAGAGPPPREQEEESDDGGPLSIASDD